MPPADPSKPRLPSECYILSVRQDPLLGKAVGNRLSDRRPLDPPPIVRLQIDNQNDKTQNYLQSPYYFAVCALWDPVEDRQATYNGQLPPLAGSVVSSLHKLKDVTNEDGGYFVFGDICVRPEGEFRLHFSLFEVLDGVVSCLRTCLSSVFKVHTTKTFPGLPESTYLSRAFSDQGVRLRIRKEGRIATKRYARSQNVGEDDGYESKQNASPIVQATSTYPDSSYMTNRSDFEQRPQKRPRIAAELSTTSSMRDPWGFTSAGSTSGLYSSMYSQNYTQSFPQNFATSSQPYGSSNPSFQNMMTYPRTGHPTFWQSQQRTDPLNLAYRYLPEDPLR